MCQLVMPKKTRPCLTVIPIDAGQQSPIWLCPVICASDQKIASKQIVTLSSGDSYILIEPSINRRPPSATRSIHQTVTSEKLLLLQHSINSLSSRNGYIQY